MPYKITWEEEGMLIKWWGHATPEDNIRSNGEMYGHERFETIDYQIADFLDVKSVNFSEKDISIIAKLESKATVWNKHLKIAHVTTDKDLIRQVKIYEEMMKETIWEFGIFDTVEEARDWINS